MKKIILVYGAIIIAVLILFQISEYAFVLGNMNIEIIISTIAIVFLLIGLFINKRSSNTRQLHNYEINRKQIEQLEISQREYQILQDIAQGLSNKEIADKLFLSESTIKTHVSNLLVKLNAKRRTQAVQIAKSLQII